MPGPQFAKYFPHVIEALKELGNSGTPSEVREIIARKQKLSDEQLEEQTQSGTPRFENKVNWAKFYLSKGGYIDSSKRGVWTLTEKGIAAEIKENEIQKLFREIHKQFEGEPDKSDEDLDQQSAPSDSVPTQPIDYRSELIEIIRTLPPAGFERLCQRLLREAGFQQVEVTGRSGDGGIDGKGILQINPLLSIQTVFQSKRYAANNLVTVSQIRDLRGAMAGRTDKGIFITTSGFTADARKEALREGVPPIELVDAEKLVAMFEKLELGLVPKQIFEVDRRFFEEFA
ncbi:MAG: restriction endonuclease [Chloroflexi bacterium]|nr:restriction endonuclease [Chloroflexota bacterium]